MIKSPNRLPTEVREYGYFRRVRARLFTQDVGIVVIKPGCRGGLRNLNQSAWKRVFRGTHEQAKQLAELLAPIIDGYSRGAGIHRTSADMGEPCTPDC